MVWDKLGYQPCLPSDCAWKPSLPTPQTFIYAKRTQKKNNSTHCRNDTLCTDWKRDCVWAESGFLKTRAYANDRTSTKSVSGHERLFVLLNEARMKHRMTMKLSNGLHSEWGFSSQCCNPAYLTGALSRLVAAGAPSCLRIASGGICSWKEAFTETAVRVVPVTSGALGTSHTREFGMTVALACVYVALGIQGPHCAAVTNLWKGEKTATVDTTA